VTKSILMPRGKGILLVRYDLEGCRPQSVLCLKPFLAFRGFHRLARKNPFLKERTRAVENGFSIAPYEGMPSLVVETSRRSRFTPTPVWYEHFLYPEERRRGFDGEEDLFLPGILEVEVERKCTVILKVSCGPEPAGPDDGDTMKHPVPSALWKTEVVRRGRERAAAMRGFGDCEAGDREVLTALTDAGRQFLITTPSGRPAIIAGYPWFGSWGRDILISLPGLCFATGRIAEGVEILAQIGRFEKDGLLPNFFSADGRPEAYNTVDSSLWYFWAIQELLKATSDHQTIRTRFWPVMKSIVAAFMRGTRFGIGMDQSGLLHAGDERMALTWMDATVSEVPVTPRHGAAVEINALWYNALNFTAELAAAFGEPAPFGDDLIPNLGRAFREAFWNPNRGCLGDVFHNGALDTAVRPNQIFAVSLPFSPLPAVQQASVVQTVRGQLLTPCGLRTLSPADPAYRGRYEGGPAERDGAYHQGTVWPWLLGAFGEACLRVAADPKQERENLRRYLRTFLTHHLGEAGIGSVSELFDGSPPHRPNGCIAQAWSVAELIRLYKLL
jgi:glycogen debranching enzyme